jgi:hypothetical protein
MPSSAAPAILAAGLLCGVLGGLLSRNRYIPFLIDPSVHIALLAVVAYGIAVHLFMQFAAIPLSAIGPRPFVTRNFVAQLIVHIVVVGPTIALTVRSYSR